MPLNKCYQKNADVKYLGGIEKTNTFIGLYNDIILQYELVCLTETSMGLTIFTQKTQLILVALCLNKPICS